MTQDYNPFSLNGKRIVVTGASSGIGQQCAISCSKSGASVVAIGRNEERLRETLSLMSGKGHSFIAHDLTDSTELPKIAADICRDGKIDGIIHCAGISTTLPIKLVTNEEMTKFFETNVFASVNLTRELVKPKAMNEGASVIFMASIMGVVGERGKMLYGMTKGALISAVRSLACELAKRKIRVNCISPGAILTPINKDLPHMADPEQRAILEGKHPLGLGETSDIANACIYLLSNGSRWVTGQNLIVDGGYTAQ